MMCAVIIAVQKQHSILKAAFNMDYKTCYIKGREYYEQSTTICQKLPMMIVDYTLLVDYVKEKCQ